MSFILEKQGAVLRAYNPDHRAEKPPTKRERGRITAFSQRSRRRLIVLLNRLEYKGARPKFLTLTFSGMPSAKEAKRAFKQFRMRFMRKFPGAAAIWRVELQQRGAPHFHLLCLGMPFWEQGEIQREWEDCTGEERSIVDVRAVRGRLGAIKYVSKYIAKIATEAENASLDNEPYQHEGGEAWQGRHWGWIAKCNLKFAPMDIVAVGDDDLQGYFWWYVRAASGGKCGNDDNYAVLISAEADAILAFIKRTALAYSALPPDRQHEVEYG